MPRLVDSFRPIYFLDKVQQLALWLGRHPWYNRCLGETSRLYTPKAPIRRLTVLYMYVFHS